MKSMRKLFAVLILFAVIVCVFGCGDTKDKYVKPVSIATEELAGAIAGKSYSLQLEADGGAGEDYEWTLVEGTLPLGMTLLESGVIQGTPNLSGRYVITLNAREKTMPFITDNNSKTYVLNVNTFEWARKITGSTSLCTNPDIAVDSEGGTHGAWLKFDSGNSANILVYGNSVETPLFSTTELTSASAENVSQAAVTIGEDTGSEVAGVAWISSTGSSTDIKFATSYDWATSLQQQSIGNGASAECDIVYTNDWNVVYSVRNGTTDGLYFWEPGTAPAQILAGTCYNPKAAARSGNMISVVCEASSIDLFVQSGASWQQYTVSSDGSNPDIHIANGVTTVVWQEDVSGDDHVFMRQFSESAFTNAAIDLGEGNLPRISGSEAGDDIYLVFLRSDGSNWLPYWKQIRDGVVITEDSLANYTTGLESVDTTAAVLTVRSSDFTESEAVMLLESDFGSGGTIQWCSYSLHAWSYPEQIPSNGNERRWPTMTKASNGTFYALWSELTVTTDANSWEVMFSMNSGTSWTPPQNVSNTAGNWSWHVASALDTAGKPHFTWYEYNPSTTDQFVYYGNYDVTIPGAFYTENLSASHTYAVWPGIAIDSTDIVHITYKGRRGTGEQAPYYLSGFAGFWTTREQISYKTGSVSSEKGLDPRVMALDSNNFAHAVWCERGTTVTDKGPYYTSNTFGSWADGVCLEEPDENCSTGCVLMLDSRTLAVWWNNDRSRIRWTLKNGSGWTSPKDIIAVVASVPYATSNDEFAIIAMTLNNRIAGAFTDGVSNAWSSRYISPLGGSSAGYGSLLYTTDVACATWTQGKEIFWSCWR